MSNGTDRMQLEFHSSAQETLLAVQEEFEQVVSRLDRRAEEYRFQQLKKQYVQMLDHKLQELATHILQDHQAEKQLNEMNSRFSRIIKNYLHQFIQRIDGQ